MKTLINTSLLVALMISCNFRATQNIHLGMRDDIDWDLIEAAKVGDIQRIENLLKQGADIETRDYDVDDDTEYTPLHHACEQGRQEAVELLVSKGAKVDTQTSTKGRTPLHYACMAGHLGVVKFLKEYGADMEKTDYKEGTPVLYAARAGHLGIVQYFHSIGINMRSQDKDGVTMLHAAAASGDSALVSYLQKEIYKRDISPKDNNKMTPFHFAAFFGHKEVAEFLLGIDKSILDLKNRCGNTALYFAVREKHEEVVKSLLAAGANATTKNNKEVSPLARARHKGHAGIVALLEQAEELSRKRANSPTQFQTKSSCKRNKRVVAEH